MDSSSSHLITVLGLFIFLFISGILICAALRLAEVTSTFERLNNKKWIKVIKSLALAYFIGFLIFRTIATFIDINLISTYLIEGNDSFFSWFFSPLIEFEEMFTFLSKIALGIFSTLTGNHLELFLGVYLPGIVILFLMGHSIWSMVKRNKFLFLQTGIIAFGLSLFLINAEAYTLQANFQTPAINLSKIIEKNEAMIFYRPMKYFNHDDGRFFEYAVDFKEGEFMIQNSTGKQFYIDPNRLDSSFNKGDFNSIITRIESDEFDESLRGNLNAGTGLNEVKWPANFVCKKEKQPESFKLKSGEEIFPQVNISNSPNCSELLYKGKVILKSPNLNVADLDFSEDGKWMAIVFYTSPYDPEEVYLVNLTN